MDYIGMFLLIVLMGWVVLFGFKIMFDKGYLTGGLLGVGTLCLISTIFGSAKAIIGLNLITLSVAFLLGIPGVVGMLLMRIVTMI